MDVVPIKSSELDPIRQLLDELDVTNALITIGTLGSQSQVANQILKIGGYYLVQVKSNQSTLLQELKYSFLRTGKGYTRHKEADFRHGSIETC